ncbi:MAG: phage holin, LLH family [Peptostreptococcaceae bacterium]
MDSNLFNLLMSLLTLIITVGGGYIINLIKKHFDSTKLTNYYSIAKQVVMSIEQLYPDLANEDKKQKAIDLILELTHNKVTSDQASTLIEAAVYEVKKLLNKEL